MGSTNPVQTVWHVGPSGGSQTDPLYPAGSYCTPWQESFTTYILGWAVMLGFEECRELVEWKAHFDLLRTNGDEVWHRCAPSPYQFAFAPAVQLLNAIDAEQTEIMVKNPQNFYGISCPFDVTCTANSEKMTCTNMNGATWTFTRPTPKKANAGNTLLGAAYTDTVLACEANFWARPSKWPVMEGDPDGYDLLYVGKGDGSYPSYLRGALTMLTILGVEGAENRLNWIEPQMVQATKTGFSWDRKWCQFIQAA
jgi:hypothetical protein